jgi:hypothetical protein
MLFLLDRYVVWLAGCLICIKDFENNVKEKSQIFFLSLPPLNLGNLTSQASQDKITCKIMN